MPAAIDHDQAVELLARLAANPAAAAKLGYRVVPVAQEGKSFLPAARGKRLKKWDATCVRIMELITDQAATIPAITDAELAAVLNDAGLVTYTGLPWTGSRLRAHLMRKRPT